LANERSANQNRLRQLHHKRRRFPGRPEQRGKHCTKRRLGNDLEISASSTLYLRASPLHRHGGRNSAGGEEECASVKGQGSGEKAEPCTSANLPRHPPPFVTHANGNCPHHPCLTTTP
jgi:hypothetical protein